MTAADVTTVEMLWESDAPVDVLRSRFGFNSADETSGWVAQQLDRFWGIRAEACERVVMSGQNAIAWVATADGPMLLKWSIAPQRFPRLAATARLTSWLAARGIPVSAPVPALDGRVQVEAGEVSMGLQRKIGGELLDVSDLEQVHAAGVALARLHEELRVYPDAERVLDADTPGESLVQRITGWLSSPSEHVPAAARAELRRHTAAASTGSLPAQLIHCDYRAANILCTGTEITAIIDFEEVRSDHPVMELARSAVLLGTLFRDWGPVPDTVRTQFRAGYESERPLSPAEASWWDALVLWWSLMLIPAGDDPTGWAEAAMSQLANREEA